MPFMRGVYDSRSSQGQFVWEMYDSDSPERGKSNIQA